MNNETTSRIRLIAVCQCITTLGVIFSNKSLINIDHRDPTVPVFKAVFRYLNESFNAKEAKIELLNKVINSLEINSGNQPKEENHENKNYINRNLCLLQNATFRLTLLAIGNIFHDNVWAVTIKAHRGKNLEGGHFLKRSKRHPLGSANDKKDVDVNDDAEDNFGNIETNSDDEDSIDVTSDYETPKKIKKIVIQAPTDDLEIKNASRDDTLGTSGEAKSWVLHHHLPFELKNSKDYNFIDMLRNMDMKLSAVKKNKDHLKLFRLDLNALALSQINENWLHEPIKVWCSETTDRWNIVVFLSNLAAKQFFFNDITLLTKVEKGQLPWKIWKPYETSDFTYRINYIITINSECGFVHFGKSKSFQNYYLTFSEVTFNVTLTEIVTIGNNRVLNMYLVNNPLGKQEWENNRVKELQLLIRAEEEKSKRMQCIEKAADLITLIVPLHTFEMSVNILKGYILKLKASTTSVPTYEDLAWDICNNLNISASYNKWKIPRNIYIDDVLFGTVFDTSMSYFQLLDKMSYVYHINHLRFNETDYNKYKTSPLLRRSLRIEDYFILKNFLQWHTEHFLTNNSKERLFVALYRLALKKCEEEWIENVITVNSVKYEPFISFIKEELDCYHNYTVRNVEEFSSHIAVQEFKLSNMPVKRRGLPVWIQIKFFNQVGVVGIDRLFDNYTGKYIIFHETFPVSEHRYTLIAGRNVLFIKIEDKRSKEGKMFDMIGKLNEILTKFPKNFRYYN